MGHASKSSSLLLVKASQARVSRPVLKTSGGTAQMVHVTSSRRLRRDQVEDGRVDAMGYVGPCYPYFTVFIVLGPSGILVFYLGV
jgi:hypothetical protein